MFSDNEFYSRIRKFGSEVGVLLEETGQLDG